MIMITDSMVFFLRLLLTIVEVAEAEQIQYCDIYCSIQKTKAETLLFTKHLKAREVLLGRSCITPSPTSGSSLDPTSRACQGGDRDQCLIVIYIIMETLRDYLESSTIHGLSYISLAEVKKIHIHKDPAYKIPLNLSACEDSSTDKNVCFSYI